MKTIWIKRNPRLSRIPYLQTDSPRIPIIPAVRTVHHYRTLLVPIHFSWQKTNTFAEWTQSDTDCWLVWQEFSSSIRVILDEWWLTSSTIIDTAERRNVNVSCSLLYFSSFRDSIDRKEKHFQLIGQRKFSLGELWLLDNLLKISTEHSHQLILLIKRTSFTEKNKILESQQKITKLYTL